MEKQQGYIRNLVQIRSTTECASKFLPLSGWAGIYALSGAYDQYGSPTYCRWASDLHFDCQRILRYGYQKRTVYTIKAMRIGQ